MFSYIAMRPQCPLWVKSRHDLEVPTRSCFTSKADIEATQTDVRFVALSGHAENVRYWSNSGH